MTRRSLAFGWLFAAAGGSLAKLPATTDRALLAALSRMRPIAGASTDKSWVLGDAGREYFAAGVGSGELSLSLEGTGEFRARRIDPATGNIDESSATTIRAGAPIALPKAGGRVSLWWLTPSTN